MSLEPQFKKFKADKLAALLDAKNDALDLQSAISAFNAFVQANFTGPPLNAAATKKNICLSDLAVDGIQPSPLTTYPQLLVSAIQSLQKLNEPVWLARAYVIQQSLLETSSTSLRDKISALYSEENIVAAAAGDDNALASLLVEVARARLVYDDVDDAKDLLHKAAQKSGFEYVVTGVSGKRTKHQDHSTAQLVCLAASATTDEATQSAGPKNFGLESDILLDQPSLESASQDLPPALAKLDPNHQPALKNVDSAILLLHNEILKHTNAQQDGMNNEELMCVLVRIIGCPPNTVNWSIYSRALWLRSALESESAHTIERGTLQMQCLVEENGYARNSLSVGASEEIEAEDRLKYINLLIPLTRWSMDMSLADRYMSLGLVKDSIEIYERLELWGDAALCYAVIGQPDKALDILDAHLQRNSQDARAWAIRGDISRQPEFWLKSWEVGKYAPAKRALARFFYQPGPNSSHARDIVQARQHLEDSLKAQSNNFDTWFLIGCIDLELADWTGATKAFTRAVSINDEDVKSWSNLAAAFMQLKKPEQALHALKQAVKANRNSEPNWRVWSNYVNVAAELQDWNAVIEGLNELIIAKSDSQEKYIDPSVLYEVVFVFISSVYDGSASQVALSDLITNKLVKVISDDPLLWRLVAKVNIWQGKPWLAISDYEKGYSIVLRATNLTTDAKAFKLAVQYCVALVDAYANYGDEEGRMGPGSKVCPGWELKARDAVKELMAKSQNFAGTPELARLEELRSHLPVQ